jgi:(p)ppGpp synthase/HD superfamily hydrolase
LLTAKWRDGRTAQKSEETRDSLYKVDVCIFTYNQSNILANICAVLSQENVNISECIARPDYTDTSKGCIDLKFEVQNPVICESMLKQIQNVNGIIDIKRVTAP